ncbi:insulinase family protein [Epibacterium sp. SM1969]|uniref:Insulinase family protein n=1 Tax=Tritonibacter aquimaris TaxID=2663379 RepID=A0A844AKL5_9RHOB|nr:pitrilysin family protein [Tritonibacter aquimaris]MQY41739.1 insulinase family protein [Tritonibacter aquimaris]
MKPFALIATALAALTLAFPAAAIEIQEVESESGVKAWLVEDHSIPFAALELRFRGGTSLDAEGKRGAINLMTGLLEEGAGELSAQDYARALESLAASFSHSAGRDSVSISARFLSENRDEAVELLRQTLQEPRFDQDALDRVRAQVLAGLRSEEKDPNDIAGKTFATMTFGDHPYGTPENGTQETVAALSRQDIFDAHERVFARDRVYVSAVGDITPEALSQIMEDLLADLPETGAPLPAEIDPSFTGGVHIVDFDTPQSVALFGQPGMEREDEDFFAAYVLNHVLGGGSFESRLMNEVREERGLTYGINSYLLPRDLAATYLGSFASANGKMAEAVEVVTEEWRKIASTGVTAEELQDAKTYLTGAYPLRFDGNARIASILVGMQIDGLPIDYVDTRNDKINAVSLEDVNRVAAELYDPAQLQFVIVGRPEGLQPTQ